MNVVYSFAKVQVLLHRQYPDAQLIISDAEYLIPTEVYLQYLAITSYVSRYKYAASVFDCDKYALILHAWIVQEGYKQKWIRPLAFGEARTVKKKGVKHAINVALVNDDNETPVRIIEPQTATLLMPDRFDVSIIIM